MSMDFYRVLADNEGFADRWFLGGPIGEAGGEIDPRLFTYGEVYAGERPRVVTVARAGRQVGVNFAEFDMLVVANRVRCLIEKVVRYGLQTFPVNVVGTDQGYCIINVLPVCICLDERKSEVVKWTENDRRPDKIGDYRRVAHMAIDPSKVCGLEIFRVSGWRSALIVSGTLREAIEQETDSGVRFEAVC